MTVMALTTHPHQQGQMEDMLALFLPAGRSSRSVESGTTVREKYVNLPPKAVDARALLTSALSNFTMGAGVSDGVSKTQPNAVVPAG